MDLKELRSQIDQIDQSIVPLFIKRMKLSANIAECKNALGLPVYVPEREAQVLDRVQGLADPEMSNYVKRLYALIFELSKEHQAAFSIPEMREAKIEVE